MELCKQILVEILQNEAVEVSFPNVKIDAGEIVEGVCYQAMQKIH